ncbi:MAG: hypothetical protein WBI82_14465 [Sphaerochaeta sp.]
MIPVTRSAKLTSRKRVTAKSTILPRNQICIGITCNYNSVICFVEGEGKPSKQGTFDVFSLHIGSGPILKHCMENGYILCLDHGKKKKANVHSFIEHVGDEWMGWVEAIACDVETRSSCRSWTGISQ